MGEEICHDYSKGAIKLCSLAGGGHKVDWDGVHGGLFGGIENESILFPFFEKVVLWGKEDMRHESCNPCRQWDDEIVVFFFVHGLNDRIQFLRYGRIVAMFPIGHKFFLQACCIEHGGTAGGHDAAVVEQDVVIHIGRYPLNDIVDVPVSCCVVATKIVHDQACVHPVME